MLPLQIAELVHWMYVKFQGKKIIGTIQNVIGVIEGAEEPDRYVYSKLFLVLLRKRLCLMKARTLD